MNVPTFSYDKIVDKDGNWTLIWLQIIMQLLQQLQLNFSDNGVVIPSQSTSNITALLSNSLNGTIWYDSDTDSFKGLVNGVVKTFTVT